MFTLNTTTAPVTILKDGQPYETATSAHSALQRVTYLNRTLATGGTN